MITRKKFLISGLVIILIISVLVFSYFYFITRPATTTNETTSPAIVTNTSTIIPETIPDPKQDRVVGILKIPNIAPRVETKTGGTITSVQPEGLVPTLKLYNKSKDGVLVTTATAFKELELREYTYEEPGVIVYGIQDQSYLIKLVNGKRGWITPETGQVFYPIEDLLLHGLDYLKKTWDRKLYPAAELKQASNFPLTAYNVEPEIRVTDIKKDLGGQIWMKAVFESGRCDGNLKILGQGWVPMYSSSGEINAWFNSRGC